MPGIFQRPSRAQGPVFPGKFKTQALIILPVISFNLVRLVACTKNDMTNPLPFQMPYQDIQKRTGIDPCQHLRLIGHDRPQPLAQPPAKNNSIKLIDIGHYRSYDQWIMQDLSAPEFVCYNNNNDKILQILSKQ